MGKSLLKLNNMYETVRIKNLSNDLKLKFKVLYKHVKYLRNLKKLFQKVSASRSDAILVTMFETHGKSSTNFQLNSERFQ